MQPRPKINPRQSRVIMLYGYRWFTKYSNVTSVLPTWVLLIPNMYSGPTVPSSPSPIRLRIKWAKVQAAKQNNFRVGFLIITINFHFGLADDFSLSGAKYELIANRLVQKRKNGQCQLGFWDSVGLTYTNRSVKSNLYFFLQLNLYQVSIVIKLNKITLNY